MTPRDEETARSIRRMFAAVARRYDFLNHLLSFNADRSWRRRAVERVSPILCRPGARVLDLCCGTGDLLLALEARSGSPVWGADFCHPMLLIARHKSPVCVLFEADALRLPLPDSSLDLVTAAFGFRNLASYSEGLDELLRVLRPGGMVAILEFSQPPGRLFPVLYGFYSRRILPLLGGAVSGCGGAYTYLPESVRRFPSADDLARDMRAAGFSDVSYERMTGGIVALHTGRRAR
jgi:demethylmenaquinone methyltransferase/2-methoxy-6-polyprenyl-1,4-benzoquinol methylase